MPASDGPSARSPLTTLEHAALSLPQQQQLDQLREHHHEIAVNNGPCGTVEATVTGSSYPPERHIFGRDAEELLAKVADALGVGRRSAQEARSGP